MRYLLILVVAICCCVASALAVPYKVTVYHDEFEDYTDYALELGFISGMSGSGISDILVGLKKTDWGADRLVYSICVICEGRDWLYISEGKSLILLANGEKIELYRDENPIREERAPYFYETAIYRLSPREITRIANAKELKIKLKGSRGFVIGYLGEEALANFKRFYKEHISK